MNGYEGVIFKPETTPSFHESQAWFSAQELARRLRRVTECNERQMMAVHDAQSMLANLFSS